MTLRTWVSWVSCLALAALVTAGCGPSEKERQAAEAARREAEAAERERQFDAHLTSGKKALADKRLDEAVAELEQAVRVKDDHPEARDLLRQATAARAAVRKEAYDQAMLRGGEAVKQNDHPAAVVAFKEALRHQPGDPDATAALRGAEFHVYLAQGRASLNGEQFADAVAQLGEAVNRRPTDTDAQDLLRQAKAGRRKQAMAQGQAAMAAKQYPDAAKWFAEAKELQPDAEVVGLLAEANFQTRLQRGREKLDAGQHAAAIPDLEEAARLKPDHADTRDQLQKARKGEYDRLVAAARGHMTARRYDNAVRDLKAAKAILPNEAEAGRLLADAEEKKRQEKAEYDRLVSSGKTYLSSRKYDEAIVEFRKAQGVLPGEADAGKLLAEAEGKKKEYDRLMTSGRSALTARKYDDAIREYTAAERIAPFGNLEAAGLRREAESKKEQELEAKKREEEKKKQEATKKK